MTVAEGTFEFLDTMEVDKKSLPKSTVDELKEFAEVSEQEGGLLPRASVHTLLGVSRQRWDQLEKEYGVKRFEMFDMLWHSRKEVEAYYVLNKKKGRPKKGEPSLRQIVSDCFEDARKAS